MVKSKKAHKIFNYLAFTAFLTIGVGLSILIQDKFSEKANLTPNFTNGPGHIATSTLKPTMPNDQLNLVVIGVDRISPQGPRVIAIWLASYLTHEEYNLLSFKPLYPLPANHPESNNDTLLASFGITDNLALTDEFIEELNKSTWFTGYVLLDEIAMIELVDLVIAGTPKLPEVNSVLLIGNLHLPWHDLTGASNDQMGLVNWLCGRLPVMKANTQVGKILTLQTQQHLSTNMDLGALIQSWKQTARQGELPQCQVNP